MLLNSTCRELDKIPLILCGPILRRVEPRSISVFVALKKPRYVELVLYESTRPSDPDQVLVSHRSLAQSLDKTIPLGQHLHALTVTLSLPDSVSELTSGRLYGYDLRFRQHNEDAVFTTLADLADDNRGESLLSGPYGLGYEQGHLPGFVLPPQDLTQLTLFHGSCRKPHGGGRDMLAALDDLITGQGSKELTQPFLDPQLRPHLLLLTGDQIYADDVSPSLLRSLHDSANQLLGWREVLPTADRLTQQFVQSVTSLRNQSQALLAPSAGNISLPEVEVSPYKLKAPLSLELATQLVAVLAELLAAVAALIEALPLPGLSIKNWITQPVMLLLIRRQLQSSRDEIEEKRAELADRVAQASRDSVAADSTIGELRALLAELVAYLNSLDSVFSELASDSDWGSIKIDDTPYQPSRIAPPQRAAELKEFAQLSSDEMDAHLMFLGEFYMMYLFVWSDAVWPRVLDKHGEETDEITLATPRDAVPNYGLLGKFRLSNIEAQRQHTIAFGKDLPKVRRVLANVPTLMIFDDHEVTDDWNINFDWVRLVNQSEMGPQILRNALIAYAVFQDWGNQPWDYVEGTAGRGILERAQMGEDGEQPDIATNPPVLDEVLSIGNYTLDTQVNLWDELDTLDDQLTGEHSRGWHYNRDRDAENRKLWHYAYPHQFDERLPFQITVLDTRTHRSFPAGKFLENAFSHLKSLLHEVSEPSPSLGLISPAALLSPQAMTLQLARLEREGTHIVVSPAPVFGLPLIEEYVQRFFVAKDNPETYDDEAWLSNPQAFVALVEHLKGHDVILLSGDVHYGFSNRVRFASKTGLPAPGERLVQLCSSSLKNETAMTTALGNIGHSSGAWEISMNFLDEVSLEGM